MKEVLERINSISGVKGSMVVGKDGIIIESSALSSVDSDLLAAMVAKVGKEMEERINARKNFMVTVNGEGGIILFGVEEDFILAVIARKDANIGGLRLEIKKGIEKIKEELG
ncbi:hypothetical protein DRQ18_03565 [bacterium]|nr:MAG: hypothetical protein DRQ18_03565 [bacterium]